MKYINLTQGFRAMVDDEDYEYINRWKWYIFKGTNTFYATRTLPRVNGKHLNINMHRVILQTPDGMYVDHINGNGLDNRGVNLRNCTRSQNQHNRGKSRNNTSGYKGVSWHTHFKKWGAGIWVCGKMKNLGRHATAIEAASAYNHAAKKYHGEFARLNSIPGEV